MCDCVLCRLERTCGGDDDAELVSRDEAGAVEVDRSAEVAGELASPERGRDLDPVELRGADLKGDVDRLIVRDSIRGSPVSPVDRKPGIPTAGGPGRRGGVKQ